MEPTITSLNRVSSRRQRLDHTFLRDRLRRATSYKRIAGYFRSSIFELVGEEIAVIPDVRLPLHETPTLAASADGGSLPLW